jgi:hypothetical protein
MSEQLMHITVTPNTASGAIEKALLAKRVPMLHGSPGVGKSAIIHEIAKKHGLKMIDLRLSQCEPQDMLGFPYVDKEKNKAGYIPMDTFPVEKDPIPDGFNGWLLFLDELTSATPPVQAAAYRIILDRQVGIHNLHDKVLVVGAGNLESDNAVVHPMSTALQSRLIHLHIRTDVEEWKDWAIHKGIDHRIIDFISFKPSLLYNFSPDHSDKTFACPRTWEFTHDLLKACQNDVNDPDFLILASGAVTEGVAREFIQFSTIYQSLPKLNDIMMAPLAVNMPNEPSILYALTGMLAHNLKADIMDKIIPYIDRMPIEFRVITMKTAVKIHGRDFTKTPAVMAWVQRNAVIFR